MYVHWMQSAVYVAHLTWPCSSCITNGVVYVCTYVHTVYRFGYMYIRMLSSRKFCMYLYALSYAVIADVFVFEVT